MQLIVPGGPCSAGQWVPALVLGSLGKSCPAKGTGLAAGCNRRPSAGRVPSSAEGWPRGCRRVPCRCLRRPPNTVGAKGSERRAFFF